MAAIPSLDSLKVERPPACPCGHEMCGYLGFTPVLHRSCPTCGAGPGTWCGWTTATGRWRSYFEALPFSMYVHKARRDQVLYPGGGA